jgi:thiol-disulfide isomerase/thioredoxin
MKIFRLIFCLSLITAASCTSKNHKSTGESQANPAEYRFATPEIPVMITDPVQQAAFLAQHYWDMFDFRDGVVPEPEKTLEEAFVKYLMILRKVEITKAVQSVRNLMEKASGNRRLTLYFADKAEQLLNHPNSPIRNESLYEEFLKGILASNVVEPDRKVRFQQQFDMAQKNKPGTLATDFEYTLKDGHRSSLYETPGKLILVYFYNPGCHECEVTMDRIVNSAVIKKLAAKGILKILAVFPDKDLELWKKHYDEMPDSWIRSYDRETVIKDRQLYDLKAIPTLYLIDGDRTVLLRDPTFEQLEQCLDSL